MYKIGHVDMGSSHPQAFLKDLEEIGYKSHGLFDEGRVKDEATALAFARDNNLKIYKSLDEMAEEVDMAFIYSVNWDLHRERIMPFIRRNKGVYIDKPMFGNLKDVNEVLELYKAGARITGGSMIFYTEELARLAEDKDFTNNIYMVFAGSPNDEYFYGVHAVYMVCGVLGFDLAGARFISKNEQKLMEIRWRDGKTAYIALGDTGIHYPFHMTLMSKKGVTQYSFIASKARKSMLSMVVPYMAGESDLPVTFDQMVQCEKACFCFKESEQRGGTFVSMEEIGYEKYYDGYEFEGKYKNK